MIYFDIIILKLNSSASLDLLCSSAAKAFCFNVCFITPPSGITAIVAKAVAVI